MCSDVTLEESGISLCLMMRPITLTGLGGLSPKKEKKTSLVRKRRSRSFSKRLLFGLRGLIVLTNIVASIFVWTSPQLHIFSAEWDLTATASSPGWVVNSG